MQAYITPWKNRFALYFVLLSWVVYSVLNLIHLIFVGFFVDINLFKASKERAAEIAKGKSSIVEDGNSGMPGKYGLADEDANLMIKLKFLTYKVCSPILIEKYVFC